MDLTSPPSRPALPGSLALVAVAAVIAIVAVNGFPAGESRALTEGSAASRAAGPSANEPADRMAGCKAPAGMPVPPGCPAVPVR